MTNTPLVQPEDFKPLLREGIAKLCPSGNVTMEYDLLQFVTAKGEAGTHGSYLLLGISTRSLNDSALARATVIDSNNLGRLRDAA